MSRNRIQMRYRESYRSNRESKQRTRAMIVLVERYCKTCICLSLSTSRNDIYMYTRETPFDSPIIDSDPDLFPLTNYLVRMMRAASRQHTDWSKCLHSRRVLYLHWCIIFKETDDDYFINDIFKNHDFNRDHNFSRYHDFSDVYWERWNCCCIKLIENLMIWNRKMRETVWFFDILWAWWHVITSS